MKQLISVSRVAMNESNGSIIATLRFRRPNGKTHSLPVSLPEFRNPTRLTRKLEENGFIMPPSLKAGEHIIGRLRRQTVEGANDRTKLIRIDPARGLRRKICKWLVEEATVQRWDGIGAARNVVYRMKMDGFWFFLVHYTLLRQRFPDTRETTAALKTMRDDGGLLIDKGRQTLTKQVWLSDAKKTRRSLYVFTRDYCKKMCRMIGKVHRLNPTAKDA